jgi:hypothetical protein
MSFRNSRRCAAVACVLATLLILSALPARALPLDRGARFFEAGGAVSGFLAELQRVWVGLWDPSGLLNAISKEGTSIDPSGQPHGATPPNPTTDEGMSIDPSG